MCPQYLRSVASYISISFLIIERYGYSYVCNVSNGCLIKYLFSSYNVFFHSSLQSGTAAKMKVRAQLEYLFLHKVKVLRIVNEIHPILKFMVNMSLASVKVKLSDISVKKRDKHYNSIYFNYN